MPGLNGEIGRKQDILGVVPYVRIHDHILSKAEIVSLEVKTAEFLPTMTLRVLTPSTTLGDTNKLNDGDVISVGIRADLKTFKPIVVDFLCTSVEQSPQGLGNQHGDTLNEYYIRGRLYIPNLDTQDIRFSYQGTAEEALMEAAKRVGLGYVENDNPRTYTEKKETWNCYNNVHEFILDVTDHMWAGKDSFFDSWVDLYYNLVNVNVGDMLGRKVEDDGTFDFTKYRSVVSTAGADGKYVHNDLEGMDEARDMKLFTNDKAAQTSVWFVTDYWLENRASAITKKYGIQQNYNVYIQNQGIGQSENDSKHEIGIGVYYNEEKLQLGYVILNGPAKEDITFKSADNGNWRNQNIKTVPPVMVSIQSDGDEEDRDGKLDNTKVSGNFSKEYVIAPRHNEINLAELEKQNVYLVTNGFNNGFAKGEKVPVVLYRQSDSKYLNPVKEIPDNTYLLDPICSGWFYVKGVKYIYRPSAKRNNAVSDWQTEVCLTRREWFPPVPTSTAAQAQDATANPATGNTKLNDVKTGAAAAPAGQPKGTTPTAAVPPQGTQAENSAMGDEVKANINNFDANRVALNAVNALDKAVEAARQASLAQNSLSNLG